jgi:hypothetical protein
MPYLKCCCRKIKCLRQGLATFSSQWHPSVFASSSSISLKSLLSFDFHPGFLPNTDSGSVSHIPLMRGSARDLFGVTTLIPRDQDNYALVRWQCLLALCEATGRSFIRIG